MLKVILFLVSFAAFADEVTYTQNADFSWHAYNENGVELPQTGSVCQGLDTAINYAVANSKQLRVRGGGSSTYEPTVNCSATLHIPPIEKAHLDLGAITLNFPPSIAGDGVVFDSCLNSFVRMDGQITYFGTGRPLIFQPVHLLPIDTIAGVTFANCEIRINTGFGGGMQTSVVDFDATHGSIIGNLFDFDEIHASAPTGCTSGYHDLRVFGANGFIHNSLAVRDLHGACNVSAFIGANPSPIHDNIYHFNIHPWYSGYGVLTTGSNDEFHISVLNDEGSVSGALILNQGASNNRFYRRSLAGGIANNSGNTTNIFY